MNEILKYFKFIFMYPDNKFFDYFNLLIENLSDLNDAEINSKIEIVHKLFYQYTLTKLEEIYSQTFDWNVNQCLYLGYYLFGETYLRSNFLSNLHDVFVKFGYNPKSIELPDHLPILLDFTRTCLSEPEKHEFVNTIIVPALNKLVLRSINEKEDQKKTFTTKNPYISLLPILIEYLTTYLPKEITLTPVSE